MTRRLPLCSIGIFAIALIGLTLECCIAQQSNSQIASFVRLNEKASEGSDESDSRPNIIFFLSDDHRHDQLGCAGHPFLKTPTIDQLAKNGTRFTKAYVTTSICASSRASIFTGLVERTHGFTFRTLPLAQKFVDESYPVLLRNTGYQTGFVGKFGVGVPPKATDKMFDFYRPLNRSPYHKKQKDGSTRHVTEIAGDKAIEFLKAQSKDRPFCLQVSFNAAHAEDSDKRDHFPWPKSVDGLYDDIKMPEPKYNSPSIYDAHPDFIKNSFNRVRYFWRWDTPEKYQRNLRSYYRMISGLDNTMGRVLAEVEKLGLKDNTVVIFSGDNGYYMAQRGLAGKWSHYEESLRVPLVISDPRSKAKSKTVDQFALNIDIPATILELANALKPKTMQGNSLKEFVDGKKPSEWRTEFFCEHLMHVPGKIPKWEGIHTEDFVYARYFEQVPQYEYLHDLKEDPDQLTNFATDATYAEKLKELSAACDKLRDAYGGEYSLEKYPINQPRSARPKANSKKPSKNKK